MSSVSLSYVMCHLFAQKTHFLIQERGEKRKYEINLKLLTFFEDGDIISNIN